MKIKIGLLTALWLLACSGPALAQVPPSASTTQESDATQLDEVVVIGSDLERTARDFVSAVSAPSPDREAAAWRDPVCVGVVGMNSEPAQALADRVSDWAHSLGLDIARPGCTPNIFIVATDNGDATARELVASRPREFHTGAGGMDRGPAALRRFQDSGKPVRWWHVSLPVNEDTGRPAVRLPGQAPFSQPPGGITKPSDLGSYGIQVLGSRLSDPLRDDLQQVIIVLESAALDQAEFAQVADYVSMVALAQVNPDAVPATPSILTLFEPGAAREPTLSRWDQAYLRALYSPWMRHANRVVTDRTLAAETARALQEAQDAPSANEDDRP